MEGFKDLLRSIRRHHISRLKKVRKQYWGRSKTFIMTPKHLGMVVQYPQKCSCVMCGNERRVYNQRTIQEKKQIQFFNESVLWVKSK